MKLEPPDIESLEPIIRTVVDRVLERISTGEFEPHGARVGYPEKEAAELMGLRQHQLRDLRLAGRVQARKLGRSFVYSREALRQLLAPPCEAERICE